MMSLKRHRRETTPSARPSLAVYLHFPWCKEKCPYCDFVSFARPPAAVDHHRYAAAVEAEIEHRASLFERYRVTTIFFGGGTPSLWAPEALGAVLDAVLRAAPHRAPNLEISVECNPSSLDRERARALRDRGVTRLSVGVQGLDPERLRFLGRWHSPDDALRALDDAVAIMPRVSADVIFGVAADDPERAQRPEEAAAEVARVAATGVSHLSAYALTIEDGTRFGTLDRQGRLPLVGEDVVAESFLAVRETLEGRGFSHYEVSNYARFGHESRHNAAYWRGDDYLGLGCAAFGTLSARDGTARRYRNPLNPRAYYAAAERRDFEPSFEEQLTAETRLRERLMLGLRMREGVDLERAARTLGLDEAWPPHREAEARTLIAEGRLERHGTTVRIPPDHWLYADGIAARLF